MKKVLPIFLANIMAFSSIVSTIFFEFGASFCLRIAIPMLVICATNLALLISIISKDK